MTIDKTEFGWHVIDQLPQARTEPHHFMADKNETLKKVLGDSRLLIPIRANRELNPDEQISLENVSNLATALRLSLSDNPEFRDPEFVSKFNQATRQAGERGRRIRLAVAAAMETYTQQMEQEWKTPADQRVALQDWEARIAQGDYSQAAPVLDVGAADDYQIGEAPPVLRGFIRRTLSRVIRRSPNPVEQGVVRDVLERYRAGEGSYLRQEEQQDLLKRADMRKGFGNRQAVQEAVDDLSDIL